MIRAYAAHERLVAPARARPQLWRLLLGLVLAAAVAVSAGFALRVLLVVLAPALLAEAEATGGEGNTPGTLLLMLYSFALVALGVAVAARALQRRDPLGLIGPPGLALRQFARVSLALLALGGALYLLPPWGMGPPVEPNLPVAIWLMLLPLSLSAVLVQVGTEEILFRGYLQQTLAARFASPILWMGLPAALFGLGHYLPAQAGGNATLIALWAVIFGLLAADLTARAGTLGPAIALHLANNVTALLIVSLPDALSGLSLGTTSFGMDDTGALRGWLVVDFGYMIVNWLAARLALRV